jgi:DsbC/DsbD-like thiol-disulfide interchange protein
MKTATHYQVPTQFAYSKNVKPKTSSGTILAKIWFGSCLAACLGSGAMLLVAWQSMQPASQVAAVEIQTTVTEINESPSLSAAAQLAASLHGSKGSSSETKRSATGVTESEVASATAWFESAQRR